MEIKATLNKPFTETQRIEFIVEQNHRNGYEIKETDTALEAWGMSEDDKTEQRKANFESNFLATSKGNYRLQPKGYANAQQSIDTVNNMVNTLGSLTEDIATMVIFYETPDFTKEEECTEEWLVAHQSTLEAMTKEEWATFYVEFTTLYAKKQYMLELLNAGN